MPELELEIYSFLILSEFEITMQYRYDDSRRYFFHYVTVKGKMFCDQCRKTAIIEAMRYAKEGQ